MTREEILQKIVDSEGNCDWARPEVCKLCPLSTLRHRDDGNPLSCTDALGIEMLPQDEHDARYKEVAGRLLADLAIEDIVERG